jgi:hypothetical protein
MEFGGGIVKVYAAGSKLGLLTERHKWNSVNGDLGRVRLSEWVNKQKYVPL